MTERERDLDDFLRRAGWGHARRQALPGDASFRRYHRLTGGPSPALAMDAPPPKEDVRPFLNIARHPGDPLTPGWASKKGARRIEAGQAENTPRIPTTPISFTRRG